MYSSLRSFVTYLVLGAVLMLIYYGMSTMFSPKAPEDFYKAAMNANAAAQYASHPERSETQRPTFGPAVSEPRKLYEQSLPINGVMRTYQRKPPTEEEVIIERMGGMGNKAPFRIRTGAGNNYYLKLLNAYDLSLYMTIFVRSHSIVDAKVPVGTYRLRYASGKKWYGEKELFGEDTTYGEFNDLLRFDVSGSDHLGITLNLVNFRNGDLIARRIGAEIF